MLPAHLSKCRLTVCKGGSRQGEAESNGTEANVRSARSMVCTFGDVQR